MSTKSNIEQATGKGGIDTEINEMAEKFATTCFAKTSFRWQKVVQYYKQGINDWIAKKIFEDLTKQEDKPPFSMPQPIQEPFSSQSLNPVAPDRGGMKWVKASERLPETRGYYYVKVQTESENIYKDFLIFDTKKIYYTGKGGKNWDCAYNVIEWLSETTSSPVADKRDWPNCSLCNGTGKQIPEHDVAAYYEDDPVADNAEEQTKNKDNW